MQKMRQGNDTEFFSARPDPSDIIFILLSVYNGEQYLKEQLASLENQSCTSWVLLWRDDGSTDATRQLMENFTLKHGPERCVLLSQDNGKHIGICNSYTMLLSAVPSGAYIAFCDQDDIWLPEKLATGLKALKSTRKDRPALYCCRQILTDSHLRYTGLSPALPQHPRFLSAMTQNIATGCSIMLSPAACTLLKAASPPFSHILHDWWAYLLTSAAGGVIITDNQPHLLYRQHSSNAVGAPALFFKRALAAIKRGPNVFMRIFHSNTEALLRHKHFVTAKNTASLQALRKSLRPGLRGVLARFSVLCRMSGLRRHTLPEHLIFCLWFLIGPHKKLPKKR